MRTSQLYLSTLKEAPSEAELVSHVEVPLPEAIDHVRVVALGTPRQARVEDALRLPALWSSIRRRVPELAQDVAAAQLAPALDAALLPALARIKDLFTR